MPKLSLYPISITQPNKNKSSGLAGTCFKEVRRNGKKYNVNCRDQKDPKYHHQWINTENLKKGKTTQCGKASKYHCSHKTYYGIKGYRNTCPIAGVTGTYTQPATLRMKFDAKKLSSSAKINKVSVTLKHRCVGVDVSNSSTTVKWGPNFYGFKHYPKRKVVTFQFVDKNGKALSKKVSTKPDGSDFGNPPLSTNYTEITALFKDITYSDISNGFLEVRYGNNLSTNPGNIYVKGLKLHIDYEDKVPYITGKANTNTVVTSQNECATPIEFNLEVGYKTGKKKVTPTKKLSLQNKLVILEKPKGLKEISTIGDSNYINVKKIFKDESGIPGEKTIIFGISKTNKKIAFTYTANLPKNPMVEIPPIFEHNVVEKNIPITARNGCASNIKIYDENINNDSLLHEINSDCINLSNQKNIIKNECILDLYKKICQLKCGFHTLYVQINDSKEDKIESHRIRIDLVQHKFSSLLDNKDTNIINQSAQDYILNIKYLTNKNFVTGKHPKFKIDNPTKSQKINWDTEVTKEQNINIGASIPGTYNIVLEETEDGCDGRKYIFPVIIEPTHKQYYDTLFVKTEGPTSLNYDYLTVWEGDKNTEPVYMNSIELKNSPDNLCFYAPKNNQSGLIDISYFPLNIKNKGEVDIKNLFIELNALNDNNGTFEVTTDEWVEIDGMFANFKNNFEKYNSDLENITKVLNLTKDNDFIDEENVYIKIDEIKAGKSIDLKIPFGSKIEKEVQMQILMFENPVQIYKKKNCTGETFTNITLNTYDSILTDLNVDGEFNLFNAKCEGINTVFETDITYTAQNIDISDLEKNPVLLIENDPRLIPVGYIESGKGSKTLKAFTNNNTRIKYEEGDAEKETPIVNQKIYAEFNFLNDFVYKFQEVTDEFGQARFFVTIPEQDGNSYTVDDIISNATFKYDGVGGYSSAKLEKGENSIKSWFEYHEDNNIYRKNETVIITVVLKTKIQYIQNRLLFNAEIGRSGQKDEITIRYKIYNLKDNTGTLYTTFKTNELTLIPNEVNKNIYCRVNTYLIANSYLTKKIVEEREINTLHIALINRKRENKDIEVKIHEINLPKYELLNINIDMGEIDINEDKIYWTIDYMNKDEIFRGTFDFIAKDLDEEGDGLSTMEILVTDFLTNNFLEDVIDCGCEGRT